MRVVFKYLIIKLSQGKMLLKSDIFDITD